MCKKLQQRRALYFLLDKTEPKIQVEKLLKPCREILGSIPGHNETWRHKHSWFTNRKCVAGGATLQRPRRGTPGRTVRGETVSPACLSPVLLHRLGQGWDICLFFFFSLSWFCPFFFFYRPLSAGDPEITIWGQVLHKTDLFLLFSIYYQKSTNPLGILGLLQK